MLHDILDPEVCAQARIILRRHQSLFLKQCISCGKKLSGENYIQKIYKDHPVYNLCLDCADEDDNSIEEGVEWSVI